MSNDRPLTPDEVYLRRWGDTHLSPQQNRVWRQLTAGEDCEIDTLFAAARPDDDIRKFDLRRRQQAVGMVVSGINKKLGRIRPGNSRFSYRLEPPTL